MKIRKWLMTAVMLAGMTAALLPDVPASAASVPTDGTGTVIENTTTDSSQREFFTIKTADGNVFYVVVDKTKTNDNVYLLTPVTEDSLKALAESAAQKNGTTTTSGTSNILGGLSGSSGTSSASGTATVSSTTSGKSSTGSAAKTQTAKASASMGNIAFIVLVAIGVFAAAFYFKIYRPKHTQVPEALDEEQDDYDSDEGNDGDEDEYETEETGKPRKPAPVQKEPVHPDNIQPEQAQIEPEEESESDTREPRAPAAPRSRRENVRQENEDGADEPEAEAVQPEPPRPTQTSARARVGGLFAPDTPNTPEQGQENPPQTSGMGSAEESEEPEPEPDETEMDYGDGMDAFGNPDEEE